MTEVGEHGSWRCADCYLEWVGTFAKECPRCGAAAIVEGLDLVAGLMAHRRRRSSSWRPQGWTHE